MVRKIIIFILTFFYSFIAYGQYLTSYDIDTSNKSEIEICKEIYTKLDSILKINPTDLNMIINRGYIFPSISLTRQEKKKGCFIYLDTLGFIPDSLTYCDVYVHLWINPYCKVQCFEILKILPNIQTDFELLKNMLANFIEGKITESGYLSENKKISIYFDITPKVKIVKR